jgi:hypothetical protein
LRDGLVRTEIPLALEVLLGQREVGVGGCDVGFRLLQVNLIGGPVDPHQWRVGSYAVADLDKHPVHLTRHLGGDFDGVKGANLANQLHRRTLLTNLGLDQPDLARCEGLLEDLSGGSRIILISTVTSTEHGKEEGR